MCKKELEKISTHALINAYSNTAGKDNPIIMDKTRKRIIIYGSIAIVISLLINHVILGM